MGKKTQRKKYGTSSQQNDLRGHTLNRLINKQSNPEHRNVGRPTKNIPNQRMLGEQSNNPMEDSQQLSPEVQLKEKIPEMAVMQAWLDLFHGINEDKGLVMNESDRKTLRAKEQKNQTRKYHWTPRHEWRKEREAQKIIDIGKKFDIDMGDPKNNNLYELLIGVSSIFAQEFTEEVYRILLNVYLISSGKSLIQERYQKAFLKYQKPQEYSNQIDESPENMINNTTISEPKDAKDTSQEENKLSRLKDLVSEICNNIHGRYYLISFRFKEENIKEPNKIRVPPSQREKAYEDFLMKVYQVFNENFILPKPN